MKATLLKGLAREMRAYIDERIAAIQLSKGDAGPQGPPGERGERGEPGPEGAQGERGEQGATGEQGASGEQGPVGEKGEPGAPGRDGADGRDGASIKNAQITPDGNLTLELTNGETLNAGVVRGEKGDIGEKGDPGAPGEKGEPGPAGAIGEIGPQGKSGIDGRDGRDGKDGKDGKDGIASIDQMKQLITEGIQAALPAMVDKTITEMFARSPKLEYRGVFSEGETYERGNFATFGGSLWHANQNTKDRPGTSDAWTLAVKKGRDGRDRERTS